MKLFDEKELRELLSSYEVSGPCPELVAVTKSLMRKELLQLTAEPLKTEKRVFLLVGLAVVMSLCLFYMFTIGTILRFVLPSYLLVFLRHTLYALTAAGGSLLIGVLVVLCFKQFYIQQPEGRLSNI